MSDRELAYQLIGRISERQLPHIVGILQDAIFLNIPEEEPDEWDLQMIADSKIDNDGSMDFDDFVKEMGLDPNELQN